MDLKTRDHIRYMRDLRQLRNKARKKKKIRLERDSNYDHCDTANGQQVTWKDFRSLLKTFIQWVSIPGEEDTFELSALRSILKQSKQANWLDLNWRQMCEVIWKHLLGKKVAVNFRYNSMVFAQLEQEFWSLLVLFLPIDWRW